MVSKLKRYLTVLDDEYVLNYYNSEGRVCYVFTQDDDSVTIARVNCTLELSLEEELAWGRTCITDEKEIDRILALEELLN